MKRFWIKILLAVSIAAFITSAVKIGGRLVQDNRKEANDAELSALYHGSGTKAERKNVIIEAVAIASDSAENSVVIRASDVIRVSERQKNEEKEALRKALESGEEKKDEKKDEKKNEDDGGTKIAEKFSAVYELNGHVVGWLTGGENLDYPVVQYDNKFYLNHDFYGNEDSNGTLFVNEENTMWPADDVILIHGHNMQGGFMFGKLLDFESYEYLCAHPVITFTTIYDKEDVCYVPIAAFNASMTETDPAYYDILQFRFEDEPEGVTVNSDTKRQSKAYEEYLRSITDLSLWKSPAGVNADDKLIMLVTCSYSNDDGRFMLVCRRLREGETAESIKEIFG